MNAAYLLLAETTTTRPLLQASTPAVPDGWMALILGPFCGLVLALIWIWWTETRRIPHFAKIVADLGADLKLAVKDRDDLRDKQWEHEDLLRSKMEAKEDEIEKYASKWRALYTKEKGLRGFWQAMAKEAYKRLGEESPKPPDDIEKTHYGE